MIEMGPKKQVDQAELAKALHKYMKNNLVTVEELAAMICKSPLYVKHLLEKYPQERLNGP